MPGPLIEPAAPPRSLRRRSWREVEFAALDFETTGLDLGRDAVVSFGVVPVREGRVVLGDSVHEFVAPAVPPSAVSMTIHQILPQDLREAPTMAEARATLARALHGRFLLAWYASVEIGFLARIFGMTERTWAKRTIDVRDLVLALEGRSKDADRSSLSVVAARYGVPVASPHEAFDDALVTAQLFLITASRLEDRGHGTVRSLRRSALALGRPAIHPT